MTPLPAAVVERVARRVWPVAWRPEWDNDPRASAARKRDLDEMTKILAEFLTIIEERGLRIVPVEPTPKMGQAPLDYEVWWDGEMLRKLVANAIEAAPPLAELLEDRDG